MTLNEMGTARSSRKYDKISWLHLHIHVITTGLINVSEMFTLTSIILLYFYYSKSMTLWGRWSLLKDGEILTFFTRPCKTYISVRQSMRIQVRTFGPFRTLPFQSKKHYETMRRYFFYKTLLINQPRHQKSINIFILCT